MRPSRASLLIALWSPMLAAQPRQAVSDSLPRDLVMALMAGTWGAGREAVIRVDAVDPQLPAGLFRDATVLGHGLMPFGATTIARTHLPADAARDSLRARLIAAGFAPPAPRGERVRGFTSETMMEGSRDVLCGKDAIVIPTVEVDPRGRTLVKVTRQPADAQRREILCEGRDPMRSFRRDLLAETPVPELPPPPGMRSMTGGSGGGDSEITTEVHLLGRASTAAVQQHYEQLFTAAGWAISDRDTGKRVAITTFTITVNGRRWTADLSFAARTDGSRTDGLLTLIGY